jgi:tyrosyl-DNA phosphodiesterase-1
VHKALRYLHVNHPVGSSIPFAVGEEFEDIKKWDWSRVRVRLILSIPETYEGLGKIKDFGICRIGSVLAEEGWTPGKGEMVKAEFQVRGHLGFPTLPDMK